MTLQKRSSVGKWANKQEYSSSGILSNKKNGDMMPTHDQISKTWCCMKKNRQKEWFHLLEALETAEAIFRDENQGSQDLREREMRELPGDGIFYVIIR